MSSSSQDPKSMEKAVVLFSSKRKSSQEAFSDRENFSSEHQHVPGNNKPLLTFTNPENSIKKHSLRNIKIICLRKQKSEERQQECRAGFSTVLFVIFRDNLIPVA